MLAGVAGYERLGDGRLAALSHVVGAVVVHQQGAQAARRDVPWEGELLLVAGVAAGQGQGCPWWPNGTAIARIPGTASAPRLREQSPGERGCVRAPQAHLCLSSSARSTLARSSARIWSVMTICSTTW